MRKKICFCLALVMLLSSMSMLVSAVNVYSFTAANSELGIVEPKILSTATAEENFADNHVLVVLNNKASLNFKSYSTADFKEIKCADVRDLSTGKKKQVEEKVSSFNNSAKTMSAENKAAAITEINEYNQILCLELADKGKENVLKAIKALEARDDVVYAGPDYMMELCSVTPNDTYQGSQWAIDELRLDDAWEITKGSSNVYVGVLDSGIDAYHSDLQGRIATALCADFTKSNWQTVPGESTGHGTHVAGIIAATMNNSKGVAGAASGVKIVAMRVFPQNEPGYASASEQAAFVSMLLEALDYAEELGLTILNLSAGLSAEDNVNPAVLREAIQNYSGLLICAAGNDSLNTDSAPVYPASIELDNILAVGASTQNHQQYSISNHGATSVDVFAPGASILSCFPTSKCNGGTSCVSITDNSCSGYHYKSGTSMAAPYVTAIAALLLSENPDLTPLQIKNKIIETCIDYTAFSGKCVSGGVVNAYQAVLKAYTHATMSANSSRTVSLGSGRHYWVKFTAPSSGEYAFTTTGSVHTVGELYNNSGLIVRSSNANSSASSNFYITRNLNQGETVYLRIGIKGTPASGNFTVYVAT